MRKAHDTRVSLLKSIWYNARVLRLGKAVETLFLSPISAKNYKRYIKKPLEFVKELVTKSLLQYSVNWISKTQLSVTLHFRKSKLSSFSFRRRQICWKKLEILIIVILWIEHNYKDKISRFSSFAISASSTSPFDSWSLIFRISSNIEEITAHGFQILRHTSLRTIDLGNHEN